MKPVSKIEYNQSTAKTVSNTVQGDIYNRSNTYYDVKNIVLSTKKAGNPQDSRTSALTAYLSNTGKTPAQLAKELSTTVNNVKSWLRGCEIEIDYWLQLKPLLEEFLGKTEEPSKFYIEDEKSKKEILSVDEAIFIRKYRNLLLHQKMKVHKILDQMEIDNIDQQWNNAGVRENEKKYGSFKTFSISITVKSQDALNRLVAALGKNIEVVSGAPQKRKKDTYILNIDTILSKDYLETHIQKAADENNCVFQKISEQA